MPFVVNSGEDSKEVLTEEPVPVKAIRERILENLLS